MTPEVVYLGYKVDKEGISPCNEKILPMLNESEPETYLIKVIFLLSGGWPAVDFFQGCPQAQQGIK